MLAQLVKAGPAGRTPRELCLCIRAMVGEKWDSNYIVGKLEQLLASQLIKRDPSFAGITNQQTVDGLLGQLWMWRVRGPNLDSWLGKLASRCNFLFSQQAVGVWLALATLTACALALDFERLWTQVGWLGWSSFNAGRFEDFLSWFLQPSTGGMFCVVFFATRIVHELGHGIACKRFGVRCPDIGVLFVLGTPCIYCDVSESWRLPRARDRAAIAAAGVYAELVVATIAAWFWLVTVEGVWNSLALQVVVCCSLSTLLINANPLMRFDGYFVLADWLGEANLRGRADQLASDWLRFLLIGARSNEQKTRPFRKAGLIAFSMAGFVYRGLLTFALASLVVWTYHSWDLLWLGRLMACLLFLSFWGLPMLRWFSNLLSNAKTIRSLVQFGLVFSCLLLAFLLVPLPTRKSAEGIVQPVQQQGVYATAGGKLIRCLVKDGMQVREEQTLFVLDNPRLQLQQIGRERDVQLSTVRLASARRSRDMYGEQQDLRRLEHTLASARSLQEDARQQVDSLRLTAANAGKFCATHEAQGRNLDELV